MKGRNQSGQRKAMFAKMNKNQYILTAPKKGRIVLTGSDGKVVKLHNPVSWESSDPEAERELILFGDNDSDIYHQRETPIIKNLVKKMKKGVYDSEKAKKLWKYWADEVASKYSKDYGGSFSPNVRRAIASEKAKRFEEEYNLGNYDNI